jgi:hypothetical protein
VVRKSTFGSDRYRLQIGNVKLRADVIALPSEILGLARSIPQDGGSRSSTGELEWLVSRDYVVL